MRRKQMKSVLWFAVFVLTVLYLLRINFLSAAFGNAVSSKKQMFSLWSFKACLNGAHLKMHPFETFITDYRQCIDNYINVLDLDMFRMGRFNENKVFLPLKSTFDQAECKWITVGIGGDDQVEKLFKEKYPSCKIFGVEASPDQYANFRNYGTIIPYGVGVQSGNFILTVRKGDTYTKENVKVMAFVDLLDKYVKSRLVHYMTIDIEGFEFGILEEILNGKTLDQQGIVFCQIDAELHSDKAKIKDIFYKFDTYDSHFIPIYSKAFLQHEKITWINIHNEECKKSFDIQQFL